jgi:hypothetical protein
MTAKELNQDIEKLHEGLLKAYYALTEEGYQDYYDYVAKAQKEFIRLYNADRDLKIMSIASVNIMLTLNLKYKFVPLRTFGDVDDPERYV